MLKTCANLGAAVSWDAERSRQQRRLNQTANLAWMMLNHEPDPRLTLAESHS